jgi:DNA repair protein RadC
MAYTIRAEYRAEPKAGQRGHYADVLSCRVVRERRQTVAENVITGPRVAAEIVADLLAGDVREHFVALLLDTRNRVLGVHIVAIGVLDQCLVHPREVFRPCLILPCAALIVAHNHPSGDPSPSPEDISSTQRLDQAAQLLGIELLDSIIIGCPGAYRSLRELGHLR